MVHTNSRSTPGPVGQAYGSGRLAGCAPQVTLTEVAAEEAQARREDILTSLPVPVKSRVEGLERLDREVSLLEADFRRERRELERKFEKLYAPVYARRSALATRGDEHASLDDLENHTGALGVPDFWLQAMKSSLAIAESITEQDELVLASLRDIRCITLPDSEGIGFRLDFDFLPNDFFTNSSLSKTYLMVDTDDCPVLKKSWSTEIQWKPGKDVTMRAGASIKGQRASAKPCTCFFTFFSSPRIPDSSDEALDPSAFDQRIDEIEADYEIGIAFKEKIVPHAVRWFTGEADDADEYSSSSEEEEEEEYGSGTERYESRTEPA